MIKLEREDWEEAIGQAKRILKQAEIMKIVNENLLKICEIELKKFPAKEVSDKMEKNYSVAF